MEPESKPQPKRVCPYCGVSCPGHVLALGAGSEAEWLKYHETELVLLGVAE
jgi:hypothetical protein